MGKKIEYTNGEMTIIWQPELCQHAGICVKMLPNVYHPKERPWVQIENATTEEVVSTLLLNNDTTFFMLISYNLQLFRVFFWGYTKFVSVFVRKSPLAVLKR